MNDRKTYPFLLLLGLTLLLYFPGLGARDFWAPVEPRYGEIVRVMFAKGEWIVPTVNGDLYTDKPILYFWIALAAAKLAGGVSEWAVRLPAALGGVGFVLATFLIGRELFNARIGLLAAAILATCYRVVWESRWAHIDMLFGFLFLMSIYFGVRSLLRRAPPWEVLLAYVFIALATLAKGLIGVVLPALLFFVFILVRREWNLLARIKLPLGVAIFLCVAGPWFYWVSRATGGKWLADFIYIHHLKRYTAGAGHHQPFYYYLTTLPADFLPWTLFAIPALFAYRNWRRSWDDPAVQICWIWFFSVFIFFTLSDTKRDLYLLPLMPTAAFLTAHYLVDLDERRLAPGVLYRWLVPGSFGLIAIAGLALPGAAWFLRPDAFWPIIPASLVLAAGGAVTTTMLRRRPPAAALSVVALMLVAFNAAWFWIFPYLEQFKSDRPFALRIKQIVPEAAPLYVYADSMNDFNYYTEREKIPVLAEHGDLTRLQSESGSSYLLIKERDLKRLPDPIAGATVASHSRGSAAWYLLEFRNHR